ncbi:type I restriction enzyme HsdR N-terminal domain-containing protein [Sinomicrobium soli]|uniref:type I restriction enzyme HsdR N-terminal domain-containing protein n=1 Tax=Sinomicrobium sp. N-1-3-6 TaxID=2219864 RepID=UPI000DCCC1A2|nr:type I restriction enzyme HsdR N-terminal domain-containing protein [Sinomicrobium sp. N-1-3-6]RAV27843.1 restriction endonuclease subunit R [Sinomicrobium sp. N-1-3-6]
MEPLHFPPYDFRFKNRENKTYIFDSIRKKFVLLQPEEWVRQHVVRFLLSEKNYPASLVNVEKELRVNGLKRRYDIVVYTSQGEITLIVECKAPSVRITQETFDQIARYNLTLNGKFLMVTNGLRHYFCQMDYDREKYIFLPDIPVYSR